MDCPDYLTAACYSSRSINKWDVNTSKDSFVNHGCSAFIQEIPQCTTFDSTGSIDENGDIHGGDDSATKSHKVCKLTCPNDNCNDEVVDLPVLEPNRCYVCHLRLNEAGEMVLGNDGCYNQDGTVDERYLETCPDGDKYCSIDMVVDWTVTGHQEMTIRRSCSSTTPESESTDGKYPVTCTGGDMENVKILHRYDLKTNIVLRVSNGLTVCKYLTRLIRIWDLILIHLNLSQL